MKHLEETKGIERDNLKKKESKVAKEIAEGKTNFENFKK